MKRKIDPKNAALFDQVFGKGGDEKIEYENKNKNVKKIDFVSLVTGIISKVKLFFFVAIPLAFLCAMVIGEVVVNGGEVFTYNYFFTVFFKNIFPAAFKLLVFSLCGSFLCEFILVIINVLYGLLMIKKVRKMAMESEEIKNKVAERLKEEDEKDSKEHNPLGNEEYSKEEIVSRAKKLVEEAKKKKDKEGTVPFNQVMDEALEEAIQEDKERLEKFKKGILTAPNLP